MVARSTGLDDSSAGNGAHRGPVWITALIGMAVAAVVGWLVDTDYRRSVRSALELQADNAAGRLQESFRVNLETLYSIGSFFQSSREVSRLEFNRFVSRSFKKDGVLQAFGYVPLIRKEARQQYVERARADGLKGFELTERNEKGERVPAGERELYAPIYYAEPMEYYHDVLGVDLWVEPQRRQALDRACESGEPVATEPVWSVRTGTEKMVLIVYLPIFDPEQPAGTIEERKAALRGFASAVFSVDRLLEKAIERLPAGIAVELFDLGKDPGRAIAGIGNERLSDEERAGGFGRRVELAGREWEARFTPTTAYLGLFPNRRVWMAVAACLTFTLVLCAWVHSMAVQQSRIARIVNERTSELIIANAALKKENKERRSAERSTQRKSSELEGLNHELESFSYSISHDLRAPLRAIIGFTGFVLRKYRDQLPEDAVHHLEQVMKGGDQMNELIEGLLQFSRIQRAELKKRNCDMGEMARAMMKELQTTMPERRVDVIWGKLPPAYGDPTLLRQVWQNLLSNALKYTGKRKAAVIEIGAKENRDGETVYYVKDNGAGFDMSQSQRLFGVFQRFHSQSQFEGTGIGLANVHKILTRHGGRIWAEAEVDKGATFYFVVGEKQPDPLKTGDSTIMQAPAKRSAK